MNRRILVPLATLVAAAAVAVGSGATFTSESNNTISSVTSGTLKHANSKADAAIFELTDLKPGDSLTGSLTLTNTGSLPASFGPTETSSGNGFTGSNLTLRITNTTTGQSVFDGRFGDLVDGQKQALGTIAGGAANESSFLVTLAQGTTDADQGETASATYTGDSVQLNGEVRTAQ